jgi:DNA-3-methyladenine glycosylase II
LKGVDLFALPTAELTKRLTAVRGLGPWSVDMFMMFSLCNPDVMPVGDLGVRRGIYRLHGVPATAPGQGSKAAKEEAAKCRELTAKWSPFSSVG